MSEYSNLRFEEDGEIATITIDRPETLNALDRQTMAELAGAVETVLAKPSIRGAIVTGAGRRAFVAGADVDELATMTPQSGTELSRTGQRVFDAIEGSKKVFVAAVNGFALGGGCELALACHLRLACEAARFGFPEVKLGTIPGYGGTVRLPRLIGRGRALEMILTGAMVSAEQAAEMGLVNRVVPADSLLEESRTLLAAILANGPLAVGCAIESLNRSADMALDDALALESKLFGLLASTPDLQEGISAFLEKREPDFRGES